MSNKTRYTRPVHRESDERDDDFARAMELLKEEEERERYFEARDAKLAGKPC